METLENFDTDIQQNVSTNWSFEITGIKELQKAGITGKGTRVTVIDPSARRDTVSMTAGIKTGKDDVHGYGIAGLIKTILPESEVDLIGLEKAHDIPEQIIKAILRGTDVINLSMGKPVVPDAAYIQQLRDRYATEHDPNLLQEIDRLSLGEKNIHKINRELKKAMELAKERGVTIVAATGYEETNPDATFSEYPNVIMVGGLKKDFHPIGTPPGGRVDIYSPGEGIAVPANQKRVQHMTSNSVSAAFVTAGAALANNKLRRQPEEIRNLLVSTARDIDGIKLVNLNNLMN